MRRLACLRVEFSRLLRSRVTWLTLLAAALCPLLGYSIYQPAGTGTTAAIVLANPLMAGAFGGSFVFAALTLFELNRVKKHEMEPITHSIVSPILLNVSKTVSLLLLAVLSAILTAALYLPYTWFRLGETFSMGEYGKFLVVFLIPSLVMAVFLAAALYQLFRRVDLSFVCFGVVMLLGSGPLCVDTYLLYWLDLSTLGFSGDFGNTAIYRMAGYSRLIWVCLFGGAWVLSLLFTRSHGKKLLGSFAYNSKKVYIPILAMLLIAGGVGLYINQPYMDHAAALEAPLDSDSNENVTYFEYSGGGDPVEVDGPNSTTDPEDGDGGYVTIPNPDGSGGFITVPASELGDDDTAAPEDDEGYVMIPNPDGSGGFITIPASALGDDDTAAPEDDEGYVMIPNPDGSGGFITISASELGDDDTAAPEDDGGGYVTIPNPDGSGGFITIPESELDTYTTTGSENDADNDPVIDPEGGYITVMDPSKSSDGYSSFITTGPDEDECELSVLRTELDLRLDCNRGTAHGTVTYQLKNTSGEAQDCLLDINPGYTVDAITVNNANIPFTDLKNDYYLSTKNIAFSLPKDEAIEMVVSYYGHVKLPANTGVLSLGDEITPEYVSLGGNNIVPNIQDIGMDGCTFEGKITLPSAMELISKGETPKISKQNGDGTQTWTVAGDGLRPAIFAGNYVRLKIDGAEFPTWFCYSKNHQREFENLDIEKLLLDTINYCTELYGPLPYGEDTPLNIVMTSAHMMGGAIGGNLSYMGENFFTAENLTDPIKGGSAAEVIAHEIIHQWWGGQCPVFDFENADWTSEALTCYTTYRMVKSQKGEQYAKQFYTDVWQRKYDDMMANFYLRNPEYMAMLPERNRAELESMVQYVSTYAKAPLQILKAEELVGGEARMDEILQNLFQNGGTEMPPYVTWHDFLDACGLTEDQLTLGGEALG